MQELEKYSEILANKLKSQHATIWQPSQFKCFSDNGDLNNFKELDIKYPGATFILNVRSLDKWLKSRILHCYSFYLKNNKPNWGYPCSINICKSWIEMRKKHHLEILEYFKNRPHKLIIVNIEKNNWEQYISDILGLKVKSVPPANVSKFFEKKVSPSPVIFKSLHNIFRELGYNYSDKNNVLLTQCLNKFYCIFGPFLTTIIK
jgi:hypothetical protein